jgi:HAD superfamily hydrolase (TIGR01490 family)
MKPDGIHDQHNQIAAFFDFDETLLAIDSSSVGFKVLKENGYLGRWFMFKMAITLFLRKVGIVDDRFMAKVFLTFYKGRQIQEFIDSADAFFDEYLRPNLAPEVVEKLRWHQSQGHETILISGSIDYYLKPVQAYLQIDHLLCTYLEQSENGILTGRANGPVCVGQNKVVLARALAENRQIDLNQSYAYGNSALDIPILECVGHPVAVNPDKQLAKYAILNKIPLME